MQLNSFQWEKKIVFFFSHSRQFWRKNKKKKENNPVLYENVKFIIPQIMSRKTVLALIRVKLVLYLCLQEC